MPSGYVSWQKVCGLIKLTFYVLIFYLLLPRLMRAAIFLVYSLFLLLSGGGGFSISTGPNTPTPAHHFHKNRQLNQNCTPFSDTELCKTEFLLSDDVEDDDVNDYTSGKARLVSYMPFLIVPSVASIYYNNSFKAPPFFRRESTPLFILHRVFRI